MRTVIAVLLENEAGALSRVVGLFAQRNYNIESLTVAPTEDETMARLTVLTEGDDQKIEQITKHLNRLIEVVKVNVISEVAHIERELMLIKVRTDSESVRTEMKRTTDIFRGLIVDVTPNTYVIQLAGNTRKLLAFIRSIGEKHIIEVVRTGVSGIARGEQALRL
ncbi:MAG: acetolactate synthase small subunit [Gammaproteobacteria bacterium]|nr:acetolactate synthase small subunit [Gammaproteobacteria bacterium]